MSEKEMFDANVPVSFSQTTVDTEGKEEKTDTSGTNEGGRPTGAKTDD